VSGALTCRVHSLGRSRSRHGGTGSNPSRLSPRQVHHQKGTCPFDWAASCSRRGQFRSEPCWRRTDNPTADRALVSSDVPPVTTWLWQPTAPAPPPGELVKRRLERAFVDSFPRCFPLDRGPCLLGRVVRMTLLMRPDGFAEIESFGLSRRPTGALGDIGTRHN
jgi:hypothetical protein